MAAAPRLLVLGTGGTISATAGRAGRLNYTAGELGVDHLVGQAGAGRPGQALAVQTRQVAQVDSKDMSFDVWQALVRECMAALDDADVAGVVITHGTDTMEETACALSLLLPGTKPVVLTGAMRPANPLLSDGPQNLADALAVAADPAARGVHVVFAGRVHRADAVCKVHPYRLDAFDSPDSGPVAVVEEGVPRWLSPSTTVTSTAATPPAALRAAFLAATRWPRVEIVLNHAGADGAVVDALVGIGVQGIVVAGTGNGTVSAALAAALRRAASQGVLIRRVSRCAQGQVIATAADEWPHSPLPGAVKARVGLLMELLQVNIAR